MREDHIAKPFQTSSLTKYLLIVLVVALVGGIGTGYVLAQGKSGGTVTPSNLIDITANKPKTAEQDIGGNRTFRDFADGKITKRPEAKDPTEYSEGTHLLIRDGAQPVALTSSVLDLSEYENKNVKVYGETQKALKEGWLMDVGKVEVK